MRRWALTGYLGNFINGTVIFNGGSAPSTSDKLWGFSGETTINVIANPAAIVLSTSGLHVLRVQWLPPATNATGDGQCC